MEIFSLANLGTLLMLIFLQAVLGFDNLLYISLESKKVEASKQAQVRKLGIAIAIALRLVLLFVVLLAVDTFQAPFFSLHMTGYLEGDFNVHSVIVLFGGVFILHTALKEIYHLLQVEDLDADRDSSKRTFAQALIWIVIMNLIFSFDSILSAMALTKEYLIMAAAIIVSGVMMIWLADHVSDFLKRNRMYEVLGLFILFIVGVMLLSEGAHIAHMSLLDYPVEPMAKSTFYFVVIVLVVIDIVQSKYQRKLAMENQA